MSNNYEDPYSMLRPSKQQSRSALDQLKKHDFSSKQGALGNQGVTHCLTLPTNQSSKVTSSINFKESIKQTFEAAAIKVMQGSPRSNKSFDSSSNESS
jgi:hypothetical protein